MAHSCQCIRIAMDIINSYCKPRQRADRRKTSENSKFSEKYLRKNGPGAASAQGRKSKFWHNTPNEWSGKVPKFHGASANGFRYRSEKPPGGRFGPPPTSNRVNSWVILTYNCIRLKQNFTAFCTHDNDTLWHMHMIFVILVTVWAFQTDPRHPINIYFPYKLTCYALVCKLF